MEPPFAPKKYHKFFKNPQRKYKQNDKILFKANQKKKREVYRLKRKHNSQRKILNVLYENYLACAFCIATAKRIKVNIFTIKEEKNISNILARENKPRFDKGVMVIAGFVYNRKILNKESREKGQS